MKSEVVFYSIKRFILWFFVYVFGLAFLIGVLSSTFEPFKEFQRTISDPKQVKPIYLVYYLSYFALLLALPIVTTIYNVRKKYKKNKPPKPITAKNEKSIVPTNMSNYFFKIGASPEDIYIFNPFRSIFVSGTAGSGKSVSFAFNLLMQAVKQNYSIIQYDFKSPILTDYLESLKIHFNANFSHYYINFNDVEYSHRVNPLNPKFLPNSTYAREYATAIVFNLLPESLKHNDFWIRSATDLLTACIWYLKEEHPDKCTLPHVCNLILNDDKELLSLLQLHPETADMTVSIYNAMKRKADAQLAGVVGTLQSAIAKINTPVINYILSGNDFDLDINNPNDPKYVSIGSTPDLADTFSPVISLIFTVAFKQMNKQNKHHSFVLLDEGPTLFIPKLESLPATARDNKVSLCYMCQDISQMVDMFGQTKAEVIISNLNSQFWGKSTNPKSAEHISRMFGKYDKAFETLSRSKGESKGFSTGVRNFGRNTGTHESTSTNESIHERSRVKPQEVLELETGEFFCTISDYKTNQLKWKISLPEEVESKGVKKVHTDFNAKYVLSRIKQDIRDIYNSDLHKKGS